MLYQIGLLSFQTNAFSIDRVRRNTRADFAVKPVVGGRKPREAIGPGDDGLTLSGTLLPFRLGGLTELDIAHGMLASQIAQPVMRGDGKSLDYHVLEDIEEDHQEIEFGASEGHLLAVWSGEAAPLGNGSEALEAVDRRRLAFLGRRGRCAAASCPS